MRCAAVFLMLVGVAQALSFDQVQALSPVLAAQMSASSGDKGTPLKAGYFLRGLENLQLVQCTECADGFIEKEPCTIAADTVCQPHGEVSLTTSAGTFNAYMEIDSKGRKWVKAAQWKSSYTLNTGAFGPISKAGVTDDAKLSDVQINSLRKSGEKLVLRMDVNDAFKGDWPKKYFYAVTDRAYQDNQPSFNMKGDGNARVNFGDDDMDFSSLSGWAAVPSNGFDNLSTANPNLSREGCNRIFFGIGANDCWPSIGNKRCVHGGNTCLGKSYPMLEDFEVWVLYSAA